MPIRVGIACDGCSRVYFIGTTDRIEYSPQGFSVICFCGIRKYFHKQNLTAYSVPPHCYARGYANQGEYEVCKMSNLNALIEPHGVGADKGNC